MPPSRTHTSGAGPGTGGLRLTRPATFSRRRSGKSQARLRLGMGPRHAGEDAGTPVAGAIVLYRALPLRIETIAYPSRAARSSTGTIQPRSRRSSPSSSRPQAQGMGLLAGRGYRQQPCRDTVAWARLCALASDHPAAQHHRGRSVAIERHPGAMKSRPATTSGSRNERRYRARSGLSDIDAFYALMQETGEHDAFGIHTLSITGRAADALCPRRAGGAPPGGVGRRAPCRAHGLRRWDQIVVHLRGLVRPSTATSCRPTRFSGPRCAGRRHVGVPRTTCGASRRARRDASRPSSRIDPMGSGGVYRFKRGFGGQIVRYAGLWERSLNPLYPAGSTLLPGGSLIAPQHDITSVRNVMPFTFEKLDIPDVVLIRPRVHGDDQASSWKRTNTPVQGPGFGHFVQINHSRSATGVLRGLHYQKDPRAQGKLLSVARGAIFDVAVDIRVGSPTYGTWVGAILSDANHHLLYVPPGFAHGFCVVEGPADHPGDRGILRGTRSGHSVERPRHRCSLARHIRPSCPPGTPFSHCSAGGQQLRLQGQ